MTQPAIQFQTTVLPGHRIEVSAPELPEGSQVTVTVDLAQPSPKRRLRDVLAGYAGGQVFRTAEEADTHLRQERESWDN